MKNLHDLKLILPEFPRIPHIPHKVNACDGDLISETFDGDKLFYVEEKLDGASCGMALYQDNAVIRNRNHILNKGFYKDTPAKSQFRPVWSWFYKNKDKFVSLAKVYPEASIYGEWTFALHGIVYDKLPDLFIAYEVYDYGVGKFLNTGIARTILQDAGFSTPSLLHIGTVNYAQLEVFCNEPSEYSTKDKREGIVLKTGDCLYVNDRFKMIRSGYVQGCNWNEDKLVRNTVINV